MALGPLLEYAHLIERPLPCLGRRPARVGAQQLEDFAIIRLVIGPEKKARPFPCSRCRRREKFRLHHAILMVAPFRPGIREKDEDRIETRAFRHHREEILRVGADKMQVFEMGTFALAIGAGDPVGSDVDADAGLVGMSFCVGRQEMAMAAPDLPHELRGGFHELG